MTKTFIAIAAAGFGFAAVQGCAVEQGASYETEDEGVVESALSGTGTLTITDDWGTGYCADVKLTNGLPEATSKWRVIMDLKTTQIFGSWGVASSATTGMANMTPVSYNTNIAPGGAVTYRFCASAPNAWTRPVMRAWNMVTTQYSDCSSHGGANPTKAALAVAMASELGRWDPVADLTISNNVVALSAAANTKCESLSHKCKNIKGILGQQAFDATIDQNLFNPTNFMEDLKASFGRHNDNIANLKRNEPWKLPVAHNLTLVSGPTNIGQVQNGVSKSCGPHYIFKVTTTNGANLTSAEATNLANALCFFGQGSCGGNPYIGYTTAGLSACPTGASCIAIDPTDGDNTAMSSTSAGTAKTYPMNRVYDAKSIPDANGKISPDSLLGSACITTTGKYGKLTSKCSSSPATCGFLYCTPI